MIRKQFHKWMWHVGLACALVFASGCSSRGSRSTRDPFAGQYSASGGGGALAHVQALTKRFSELHPGVVWLLEDVGSDASITLVAEDDVDLGFISRELKSEENGKVELLPIGAVGTAVAVNSANPVMELTREQVKRIFSGEIRDWSEVRGNPGKIRVLVRERDSATRSSFETYFFGGKATYSTAATEVYEIDETLTALQSFRNSIGMVTLADRTLGDPRLRLLAIDGVAATTGNLYSGTYKIRRPLYLAFNPDPRKVKPAIRSFLDFAQGVEGQRMLRSLQ